MQEELCRFTHGTNKEQNRQHFGCVPCAPEEVQLGFRQRRSGCENVVEFHTVDQKVEPKDTKREAKVADTVDDERFHSGGIGRWFAVVKADQQI